MKQTRGLKQGQTFESFVLLSAPGGDCVEDMQHLRDDAGLGGTLSYKAFQPMEVSWAEAMLILADEFRDGNVPPSSDIARLVDEAYEMLPPGLWQVKVRSDSAGYQQDVLIAGITVAGSLLPVLI